MTKITTYSVIATTIGALAIGAVDVQRAVAAPVDKAPSLQTQQTDLSSRRRHRYYRPGGAAVLGAVTSIFGTIAAIAAADAYRQSYDYPDGYYPYAPAAYPDEAVVYPYQPAVPYAYQPVVVPYAAGYGYRYSAAPRIIHGGGYGHRHGRFH